MPRQPSRDVQLTNYARGALCHVSTGQLQVLNLSHCVLLTDEGVLHIAANCPSLVRLELEEVTQLTDRCIDEPRVGLVHSCLQLQHLSLSRCRHLTLASVRALAKRSIQLRLLDMTLVAAVDEAAREGERSERGAEFVRCKRVMERRSCQLLCGYQMGLDV